MYWHRWQIMSLTGNLCLPHQNSRDRQVKWHRYCSSRILVNQEFNWDNLFQKLVSTSWNHYQIRRDLSLPVQWGDFFHSRIICCKSTKKSNLFLCWLIGHMIYFSFAWSSMNNPKRNPLSCDAVGHRAHELINYPAPSIPLWISRLDKLEVFWEPDIWRSTKSIVVSIAAAITVIWIGNLRAVRFTILNIFAKRKKIW